MTTNKFLKVDTAVLDFQWDWTDWLGTDTISSATVTVPTGITLASTVTGTKTVTAWLSGGTAGSFYTLDCKITTAGGRQENRIMVIEVVDVR